MRALIIKLNATGDVVRTTCLLVSLEWPRDVVDSVRECPLCCRAPCEQPSLLGVG